MEGGEKMWRRKWEVERGKDGDGEVQGWNNNPLLFPITVSIIESMRNAIIGSTCWNNAGRPDTPRQFFQSLSRFFQLSYSYSSTVASVSDFRSSVQPPQFSRLRFNNIAAFETAELNAKKWRDFEECGGGGGRKPTTHQVGETG